MKIGSGKTPKGGNEVYSESGVIFLRSQNVYDDGLRLDDVVYIDDAIDSEMHQTRVRSGDVLLNITGASIGRTCIVPQEFPRANVNQHVCIIRLRDRIVPEYVSLLLKAKITKDQVRSMETGSSREGLNFEQVGTLLVIGPLDSPHEQRRICQEVLARAAKTESTCRAIENQIAKLQEYRQTLISAAVTGKIDVTKEAGQ